METITIDATRFQKKVTTGGINSEFNNAVDRARNAITDITWSFGRWCGYLRGIPAQKIHEFVAISNQSQNVGRKFFYLVRTYRQTI